MRAEIILALRKENEPEYATLCEEVSRLMPKTQPMDSEFPIDFKLIQNVMRNEAKRELEKQWKGQAGLRAKRRNLSTTGKNRTPVLDADSTSGISK